MVEDVFNIGFLQPKFPPVGHCGSDLEKKKTCLCKASFLSSVPSLNKIGKCMSEKWVRMCLTLSFLQLKWLPIGRIGSDVETKCRAYASHH